MVVDLEGAVSFVATHGRVLDRRRLHLLLGAGPAAGVLDALDAYRNPDDGYGWGLEPDLRSATSQPVAAMHALEALAEARDPSARTPRLLDWLAARTLPDGGVPFALPFTDRAGSAPHWVDADPAASSLQMTAQLAAQAHRLARHRQDVAEHPWLVAATRYCLDAVDRIGPAPHPYELMFTFRFLDAVADGEPRAREGVERLARYVVADGPTPVPGTDGEVLHPLDLAGGPGTPSQAIFPDRVVAADLDRLTGAQQPDGGWTIGFTPHCPAAALEWRGYATVGALTVLRDSGRWSPSS